MPEPNIINIIGLYRVTNAEGVQKFLEVKFYKRTLILEVEANCKINFTYSGALDAEARTP